MLYHIISYHINDKMLLFTINILWLLLCKLQIIYETKLFLTIMKKSQ